jgi:hypothetical protein
VITRSRARGLRPALAPAPQRRLGSVLTLQRMAGNRAVCALVARTPKVAKIGEESVNVASKDDEDEAARIIADVKAKYGVTINSVAAKKATLDHYHEGDITPEARKALDVRPWEMDELRAVHKALGYFAPVLGEARKKSSLKSDAQEIVNVGKLNTAPDDDPAKPDDRTRGQYFREQQTFSVFEPGPDPSRTALEVATHEIAHGIFDRHIKAFMKATGYWSAEKVKHKEKDRVEGPPDGYGDRNAKEDLAQSVMYFFTNPKRLLEGDGRGRKQGTWGNKCPLRHTFIKKIVKDWKR